MRPAPLIAILTGCAGVFDLERLPDVEPPPPVLGRWTEVAAGLQHTCALDLDGHAWCWGSNREGQAGVGSTAHVIGAPEQVGDADVSWSMLAAHGSVTCGLQADGSLWCWGRNDDGQLGDGTTMGAIAPRPIGADTWLDLDVGPQHGCAVRADHTLWCWGDNDHGQLGNGTQIASATMVQIGASLAWSRVSAGRRSTCAIAMDGSLHCWGHNEAGQLGLGAASTTPQLTPARVGTDVWTDISLGDDVSCGITEQRVQCWGANGDGELGDGMTMRRPLPDDVPVEGIAMDAWATVKANGRHLCARTLDGRVFCWGNNAKTQLAVAEPQIVRKPVEIVGARPWTALAVGVHHTCLVDDASDLFCTGGNAHGQHGDGGSSTTIPVRIGGETLWSDVTVGTFHTCALDDAGVVHCTGFNEEGQLGIGTYVSTKTLVSTQSTGFTEIAAGLTHTCGTKTNQVYCWGSNYAGQLGTGTDVYSATPVSIRAGRAVSAYNHTCALDGNRVWCWGQNHAGQVGNGVSGEFETELSPNPITSLDFTAVGTGRGHTCAINAADAQVHCWGNMGDLLPPDGAMGWTAEKLFVGGYHGCTMTNAGSAACWGANYVGQLGVGMPGARTTPQPIVGTWSMLAPGWESSCGIQTNGSLWCWGNNGRGQLGTGTYENLYAPARVGTDADWITVATLHTHTCAIKEDRSLWCWGENESGQLGLGNAWTAELVRVP